MAKYVESTKGSSHRIDFIVDGEFVVPSAATYTLRKNDGTVVGGLEDETITLTSTSTSTVISVSGANNTATLPYELRYLEVAFTYGGAVYRSDIVYNLRTSIRFPLSVTDVEAVLGTSVPDGYIDILSAYDLVQLDAPEVNLGNILSGGTVLLPSLIEAVKYKAALDVAISIQNSMMQMEQADNTLYRRFEEIDFEGLRKQLSMRYSAALDKLLGVTSSNLTTPLYSTLAQGTDAVTGQ